jgi:hypothetical protein
MEYDAGRKRVSAVAKSREKRSRQGSARLRCSSRSFSPKKQFGTIATFVKGLSHHKNSLEAKEID